MNAISGKPFRPVISRTAVCLVLAVLLIIWIKAGLAQDLSVWTLMPVMVTLLVYTALVSPPASLALFTSTHYLIGQVSIAHSGISALSIMSAVLVMALVLIRWRDGTLAVFLRKRSMALMAIGLLAVMFMIGFIGTLHALSIGSSGYGAEPSLLSMFTTSGRNTNDLLHYVFISHWLTFVILGMLACSRLEEFRTFLVFFALLYIAEPLALPFEFIVDMVKRSYLDCEPVVLSLGNVNRSYVGYIAAMASVISLALAQKEGGYRRFAFILWMLGALVVLALSGSKGPLLAWALGTIYILYFTGRQLRIASLTIYGTLAAVLVLSVVTKLPLLPCGFVKQYTDSVHSSIWTRAEVTRETLQQAITPAVAPEKDAVSPAHRADTPGMAVTAKPPTPVVNSESWSLLVGRGFGASTRSVNTQTGNVEIHSGSLNLFVDLFAETGVLGLGLFIGALALLVAGFFRAIASTDTDTRRFYKSTTGAILLILLVKLLVAADTHTEDLAALFVGVLAGVGHAGAVSRQQDKRST